MKKISIIFWATTGFIFLFEGLLPLSTLLFAPEYFNAGTKPLGYPDYFAYALIICKVLGATALIVPNLNAKIKEWAYAGLTFSLLFAALSHTVVDGNVTYILTPIVIGAILSVSYIYRQRITSLKLQSNSKTNNM